MLHPPHLSADQKFIRSIYLGYLAASEPMETFATWVLTGVGATVGALMTHAKSIMEVVTPTAFRFGMICLVVSILFGVIAKQFGMAIRKGVEGMNSLYADITSETGLELLKSMTLTPDSLIERVVDPLPRPVAWFARRQSRAALTDYLNAEKLFLKMFGIQFYAGIVQDALAIVGLMVLVCGLMSRS